MRTRRVINAAEPPSIRTCQDLRVDTPGFRRHGLAPVWWSRDCERVCAVLSVEEAQVPRKGCPPEFRRRAVELLRSGRPVAEVARLPEVSDASLYLWRRRDRIDRGEIAGASERAKQSGLVPSMGSIGDSFDSVIHHHERAAA
jgi:transposase-like protein